MTYKFIITISLLNEKKPLKVFDLRTWCTKKTFWLPSRTPQISFNVLSGTIILYYQKHTQTFLLEHIYFNNIAIPFKKLS